MSTAWIVTTATSSGKPQKAIYFGKIKFSKNRFAILITLETITIPIV